MVIDDSFLSLVKSAIAAKIPGVSDQSLHEVCEHISTVAGGEMVYISKTYGKTLKSRNLDIVEEYTAGKSISCLAVKYRLSEKHIYKILSH